MLSKTYDFMIYMLTSYVSQRRLRTCYEAYDLCFHNEVDEML